MVEIDQTFLSFEQWQAWTTLNPSVFDLGAVNEIGRRILAAGFIEPLTERVLSGTDIKQAEENWREGLMAQGLNSRMRAVLAMIEEKFGEYPPHEIRIFAAEAITAFALRLRGHFARFLGSEYGADDAARRRLYPIPHEDLTALTLPSDSFHLVVTNEVMEHVPDLDAALREIARILMPGGWHVGTFPFRYTCAEGDRRAFLSGEEIIYIKEPEYHGNPVDADGGSLVFETPAWDINDRARVAGFCKSHMRFLCSERQGYLSEIKGIFVFCAQK